MYGDLDMIRLLVEAGADVAPTARSASLGGDCFRQVREDVASTCSVTERAQSVECHRARRVDVAIIAREPALLAARMTRRHHRRTPLHHAAARNRLASVQLLRTRRRPNATDAPGATALTTACRRRCRSGDRVRSSGGRRTARFPDEEVLEPSVASGQRTCSTRRGPTRRPAVPALS